MKTIKATFVLRRIPSVQEVFADPCSHNFLKVGADQISGADPLDVLKDLGILHAMAIQKCQQLDIIADGNENYSID